MVKGFAELDALKDPICISVEVKEKFENAPEQLVVAS